MPLSYTLDRERRFVRSTWAGPIGVEDLRAHWSRLFRDPEALSFRRSLADLRTAELRFNGVQLEGLIGQVAKPEMKERGWRVAFLVARPDQFGVSRQYGFFAETFSRDAIFEDEDQALAWLLKEEAPKTGA